MPQAGGILNSHRSFSLCNLQPSAPLQAASKVQVQVKLKSFETTNNNFHSYLSYHTLIKLRVSYNIMNALVI